MTSTAFLTQYSRMAQPSAISTYVVAMKHRSLRGFLGAALLLLGVGGCGSIAAPHHSDGINMVVGLGDATTFGVSPTGHMTSIVATTDGYWILDADGAVHAFGSAPPLDSIVMPGPHVFAMDATQPPHTTGLWILRTDGGVLSVGDAPWAAGTWGRSPSVAMGLGMHLATDGSADGGWVVYQNGDVRAFGAAPELGDAGTRSSPAIDIAITATGQGAWVLYRDGSLAVLGDAPFLGDVPGRVSIAVLATPNGGYWLVHADGGISPSPGSTYFGDVWNQLGSNVTVDASFTPNGTGAVLAATFVPPPPPPVPDGGTGRRIVYSNSGQRVWVVNDDGSVVLDVRVSGKTGVPRPGTYHVYKKSENGRSGSLRLPWFTSFAPGASTDIGFHGIPLRPDGSPIESDAQLGTPLSHGCVRMNQQDVKVLYDWAHIGDRVVVLP